MLDIELCTRSHRPEQNAANGAWASQRIWGCDDGFGDPSLYFSYAIRKGGEQIAAVVCHHWQQETGTIEISGAGSDGWQSRRFLNELFGTCFDVMGCQMVIMKNGVENTVTRKNSERLGFTGHLIPRLGGRGKDLVLYTLTDDQWRESRFNTKARK